MMRKNTFLLSVRRAIFLLALFLGLEASAQIEATLFVSSAPPANIFEWGERREVVNLLLRPSPGQVFSCKIRVDIKSSDGATVMTTDLNRAPTYNFAGSANIFLTAADLIQLSTMNVAGSYQKTLERTGNLPSGNYQLCVQVLRLPDLAPASQQVCRSFFLAAQQLPILMMPADGQELDEQVAQSAIIFRWTPLTPRPAAGVVYRIQAFEVLERQSPLQALRSNQPLLDRTVFSSTQYIWQPQLGMPAGADSLTPVRKYVWTIQTLDANGQPFNPADGNGEGRSEPKTFSIKARKPVQ